MRRGIILILALVTVTLTEGIAQELPRVVLIGDSIRLGYAPIVAKKLEGRAEVISVEQNGGDSRRVRANLEQWALAVRPAIVHFNAGLHDLKLLKATNQHQVPLEQYS
ncbi:MAG: SGNH/GDSL hydrolase family protein, partial [Acidobacteriota bacterium]